MSTIKRRIAQQLESSESLSGVVVPQGLNLSAAKWTPQIRVGGESSPWCDMGKPIESKECAESIASMYAKWWLGIAESRAVEVGVALKPLAQVVAQLESSLKPESSEFEKEESEYDEVDKAELHREYVDNIARNHDVEPVESL